MLASSINLHFLFKNLFYFYGTTLFTVWAISQLKLGCLAVLQITGSLQWLC